MVEINTQASNVVDNTDSLGNHLIEYAQEEVETYEREANSDDNVMSPIGSDLVLQTESGTPIHVSVMKSHQSAMSTASSPKIEGSKDCQIEMVVTFLQKKSNSEIVHPIQLVTSKNSREKVQDTVLSDINCSFTDSIEEKHDVSIPSLGETNSDNDSKSNSNSDNESVSDIDFHEFGNNLLNLNRNLYMVVEEFDDILNEIERDIDQVKKTQ